MFDEVDGQYKGGLVESGGFVGEASLMRELVREKAC